MAMFRVKSFWVNTSGMVATNWVLTSGLVVGLALLSAVLLMSPARESGARWVTQTVYSNVSVPFLYAGNFDVPEGAIVAPWGYRAATLPGWIEATGLAFEFITPKTSARSTVAGAAQEAALDMEASPGNLSIQQQVQGLKRGARYTLSFRALDVVGNNRLVVLWNGAPLTVATPSKNSSQVYTAEIFGGTGNGQNVLSFIERGPVDGTGTYLDDVIVR